MAEINMEVPLSESIFAVSGQGISNAAFSDRNRNVMKIEFNADEYSITVPSVTDADYSYCAGIIDWGDGAEEEYNNLTGAKHTYFNLGAHTVKIWLYIENICCVSGASGITITGIELPPSVREISGGAFKNMNLANLIIPPTVEKIRESAFEGNPKLTKVTISHSCVYYDSGFPKETEIDFYPYEEPEGSAEAMTAEEIDNICI
ncbi:MAG: leucine-rich repeat protein [Porcipelethomonas sp.]